ncbi:MAG TPA: class I SAM-dependent methyltransferase [Acidobacteriaceae bacterium]|nr:class I SAM-dependent methyltransferase [Acidobacteriaceae bacterium]
MTQSTRSPDAAVTPRTPVPRFDRIAKPYRWLEYLSFGPLLQRTRTHWLGAVGACRHALVLGDGDGRFTAALLAAHPGLRVHAVDGSAAMLRLLRARCSAYTERLTTEQTDLRTWTPAPHARYDLIATHFFLDCLTSQEASDLAQRFTPALTRQATWLVSDFAIPATHYGRWIAAPVVGFLYRAFRMLTGLRVRQLPDHAAALSLAGWSLKSARQHARGLLISELWKLPQDSR